MRKFGIAKPMGRLEAVVTAAWILFLELVAWFVIIFKTGYTQPHRMPVDEAFSFFVLCLIGMITTSVVITASIFFKRKKAFDLQEALKKQIEEEKNGKTVVEETVVPTVDSPVAEVVDIAEKAGVPMVVKSDTVVRKDKVHPDAFIVILGGTPLDHKKPEELPVLEHKK